MADLWAWLQGLGQPPGAAGLNSAMNPSAPDWLKNLGGAIGAGGLNPGGSGQFDASGADPSLGVQDYPGLHPALAIKQLLAAMPSAAAAPSPSPAGGSGYGGVPPSGWADPNGPDPIGDYVKTVGNHGMWPTPPGSPSATPTPADAPLPPPRPKGPLAKPAAAGAPSANPPVGRRAPRFIPIQFQSGSSGASGPSLTPDPRSRAPIFTALNLGGR